MKTKNIWKRIASLAMALVMVLGMLPTFPLTAHAAGYVVTEPVLNTTEVYFTGEDEYLSATPGEAASGYEMLYSVQDGVPVTYSDKCLAVLTPGTYPVYYWINKEGGLWDIVGRSVKFGEVTMHKAKPEYATMPVANSTKNNVTSGYTLLSQEPVPALPGYFAVEYEIRFYDSDTDTWVDSITGWSTGAPTTGTYTNGKYEVQYKQVRNGYWFWVGGVQYDWDELLDEDAINNQQIGTIIVNVGPDASVTAAPVPNSSITYNGSKQELLSSAGTAENGTLWYAVTPASETTAPTSGWSTAKPAATNAGSYKVWYQVKASYQEDIAPQFVTATISSDTNAWATEPDISDYTYGETPSVTMGTDEYGNTAAVQYTGTGNTSYNSKEPPTDAGSYKATFTVAGTDNYKRLSKEVSFKILPKPITNDMIQLDESSEPYTAPTVTVMDGSKTLTENIDYTLTWNSDGRLVNPGENTVTITGKGNYGSSASAEFTICGAYYDENGICSDCGGYQSATLVTAENYSALGLTEGYVGYYAIANAGQLMWFAKQVNGGTSINGVLTKNIDLEGIVWVAMGQTSATAYTGTFDGKGHTIYNLSRETGTDQGDRASFMYYLGANGHIKDVIFDKADVFTQGHAGANASAVVVLRNSGTISGCIVRNSSVQLGAYEYLAGIAGVNESGGVIENCAVINTSLTRRFGHTLARAAIVHTNNGTVENCFAYGCTYINVNAANGGIISTGNEPINCYYYTTATVATTYGTAMTTDQFASGEVAYLLNGSDSDGVWKQTIGSDAAPDFTGKQVYCGYADCQATDKSYSNTELSSEQYKHNYESGICTNTLANGGRCGAPCLHTDETPAYKITTQTHTAEYPCGYVGQEEEHSFDAENGYACVCGEVQSFTLTWKVGDKTVYTETVKYGAKLTAPDFNQVTVPDAYYSVDWDSYPSTMPAENYTVEGGYWTVYVTFYSENGSYIKSNQYAVGSTLTLYPASNQIKAYKTGYTTYFLNTVDGQKYEIKSDGIDHTWPTVTLTGNMNLKPVYEPNTYSVTFNAGAGSGTMASASAQYGGTYTLPENSFTAPEGYHFKGWSIGGTEYEIGDSVTISGNITVEAVWEEHSYNDEHFCTVCGASEELAYITSYSITLQGNIGINFYAYISDTVLEDEDAYVLITYADGATEELPVSEATANDYGYKFTAQVAAKEMTDTIKAQIIYTGGSSEVISCTVKDYADYMLTNSSNDKLKALVEAMLVYGAAAQMEFSYNTDNLAAEISGLSGVTADTLSKFNVESGQGTDLVKFYAPSLILKSETTLRFYFTAEAEFTATLNGEDLTVTKNGSYYCVDITNISAKNLDETYTLVINDGTSTANVSCSPLAYGYLTLKNSGSDENLCNVVRALYLYNQAANDYFG